MSIEQIVEGFNTTPFIFAGSGITRRYLGLPDREGLLYTFTKKISDDEFAYRSYMNKAKEYEIGLLPKVAELIQKDFDERWFAGEMIRTSDSRYLQMVKAGASPFKVEVAAFINSHKIIAKEYRAEVELLKSVARKSISGIITTNYDCFFENICDGYTKYVGQEELIFSAIQGIAEIYKIHGSVEIPDSIIINEKDYSNFDEKSPYLASKLMTLFMEYPIIFIGYSMSDKNVQKILKAIVSCLDEEKLKRLSNRFIFIEYSKDHIGAAVSPYTIMIDDKHLEMKKTSYQIFRCYIKHWGIKK